MRIQTGVFFLVVATLCGQGSGWKEFSIGPMTKAGGRYSREGIRGEGVPLKRVLSKTFDMPEHRILAPDWVAGQRYALTAIAANPADFPALMQQELTARFQFLSHRETRTMTVYVMKPVAGSQAAVKPAGDTPRGLTGLKATQSTMKDFLANLSDLIQRPVIDESRIDGTYDLSLFWKPGDMASLKAAVKDQLGCELTEESRNVDLLVVDRIERPQLDAK